MTTTQPEAPFGAPWHGQAFALAVALNEAGHFTWVEWTARFSQELKSRGETRTLDGSDDYYEAWVATLEAMMVGQGAVGLADLADQKSAWEDAYLTTPHGQPVVPVPRSGD